MRTTVFLIVILVLGLSAAPVAAADPSILAGTWAMNVDESDDPMEEMRLRMQRRPSSGDASAAGGPPAGARRGGGGGGGGGGGTPGAGGFGGGGNFGGGARGLIGMMRSFSVGSELLKISFADPELTIELGSGAANMVFTDGRLVESEGEDGGVTKVRTRWKKDKLTVAVNFPPSAADGGGTISPSVQMVYSLDKQGRLSVKTTVGVGGGTPPFTLERIYDSADG
ncbi:MAG: hypothetical protein VYE73_11920 [Acidobacteriota bacterium]|nr:hypothetical protein [Acidobacteriota bacterium]